MSLEELFAKNRTIDKYNYDVSLIIPAYNEERRIKLTLESIDDYFSSQLLTREIIVVDDGSRDDTAGVVEELKKKIEHLMVIRYERNRGKGYAIKTGIEHSNGEYIFFADADNSTPIQEFEKFYSSLKDNKVVIGSRYILGSNVVVKQRPYRVILSRCGNMLIRFFLLDGIRDTQCGFKAFQHEAAREIFRRMKMDRFGFDVEIILITRLLNYSVKEIPVSWLNSSDSRVRPIRDALRTFKELIYIKLNLWSGRYQIEKTQK
jgi:dolichyl-phosphate beta-glucosyltransferase